MRTERLEVRVDRETRGKLEEMAAARRSSISELMRALIERFYEEQIDAERIAAAERIGAREVEDVPEPGVLKQQLSEAYDTTDPR